MLLVILPMPRGFPERPLVDGWGDDLVVAIEGVLRADESDELVEDARAVGEEERGPGGCRMSYEQVLGGGY